jgi:hypothetical protein
MAKSYKLPYSSSNKVSSSPLELIYSYVWGPAPASVGKYTYYVSFIDDYSKYTWIYLLQRKSDVLLFSKTFRSLLNANSTRRSYPYNLIGEESMRS